MILECFINQEWHTNKLYVTHKYFAFNIIYEYY